jgi:hypothetical protein
MLNEPPGSPFGVQLQLSLPIQNSENSYASASLARLGKKTQNGSERSSIYVSIDLIHLLVASEEEESSDKQIPGHGNPVQS